MMNGIRSAANDVATEGRAVVQGITADLKRQSRAAMLGVGFGLGAAVFVVFGVAFALATIAFVLATFLATWLALLIVTAGLFLFTFFFVVLAARQFKRIGGVSAPAKERARFSAALSRLQRETTLSARARAKVPVVTGAAGFVLGGGLRAAARLARRRRG
jgi:hypothetical protein